MDINGPIKIGVLNDPAKNGWELQVDFSTDFQQLTVEEQAKVFGAYLNELTQNIHSIDENDSDYMGLMIVHQLCEQFMPYIKTGEMALTETIVVEVAQAQAISLTDLLN